MAWILLVIAGVVETIWPLATKYSDGMRRPFPTAVAIAAIIANVFLLSAAMKKLPVATVYAVLIGSGAIGTTIASATLLGERVDIKQWIALAFIVGGILGLKLMSPA